MNKVLWTSGWDSTFRILQLMLRGEEIQPYYIIDTNRNSTLIEIKRMNEIRNLIEKQWPDHVTNLKSTIFIEMEQIRLNQVKSKAYQNLRTQAFMGSQYEWMASLSAEIGELELCVHVDDKVYYFLNGNIDEVLPEGYVVSKNAEKDVVEVFGNLKFPVLEYSKVEMMAYAKKHNFFHIMERTWFCFTPINNEPCGICNPCSYSIEEGMGFRFSKKGRFRNRNKTFFKICRRVINKLGQVI